MPVNSFVWYELLTKDIDPALSFYGDLLGWTARDFPGDGDRYAIVSAEGKGVGGVMTLPAGMTAPLWMPYVGAADIDSAVAGFTGAGGKALRSPWDIPNVGRLAVIADPQGAPLAMIQSVSGDQTSEAFNQKLPGHGNWHELATTEPDAAMAFYAQQFGWTKGETHDMGPMGAYQIFRIDGVDAGGIVRAQPGERPMWLCYFGVKSIPEAAARITANGGTLLHGPAPVPGGAHIVQAKDPQGAMFALVGPGS